VQFAAASLAAFDGGRPQAPHAAASPACASSGQWYLGEAGPLSRGVQAGRKAHRTRHINGVEVRKKRPRGFK
jgi:hypothetical protein